MRRRALLRGAAMTAAATATTTALSRSRVLGANDRIHLGLVGCGGRGRLVSRLIRGNEDDLREAGGPDRDPRLGGDPRGVAITALSDVFRERVELARRMAPSAAAHADFRRLLDDRDVDAIVLATPDHWHAAIAVLACEAGKHVYLEKPVMYAVREARAIREAVRRSGRIVQVGTQHRSAEHIAEAARLVQGGRIGTVHFVRVWNYRHQGETPPRPDAPVPDGLDWDFWLGPAPAVPFNPDRLEYRNFMDYTNGVISDYGMHRFDSVHQIMGRDAPLTVASAWIHARKGRVAGDLPEVHQATYEYPGFVLSYECNIVSSHGLGGRTPGMRYYAAVGAYDRPHGMAFYGTDATLFVDRIGMELYPEESKRQAGDPGERLTLNEPEPTAVHCRRFVDALRGERAPAADIETGCRSSIVPLLGNIAARLGRKLRWDAASETFPGSPEADALLFREYRKPWDLVRFD